MWWIALGVAILVVACLYCALILGSREDDDARLEDYRAVHGLDPR
jgi:hypothetical protein